MEQNSRLEGVLQGARLPSMPHVLLEIYDLLHSEVAGVEQIVALLESDTGLAARTLRLANSACYGRAEPVSRVARAVLRVGPFDLWWLLFTTEVKNLFFGIDSRLMNMELFWRHSLFTACASREISGWHQIGRPGDLFVAGLLHDVGKLLLLQRMPVEYGALLADTDDAATLVQRERGEFGFTHAQAGGRLLAHWRMPELLVAAASRHHDASPGDGGPAVVALANRLAHEVLDERPAASPETVEPALVEAAQADYEALIGRIL
ncbi:MAG TPA: HDOD domain-containing protein [Sedimenticola thiotaurini]|uniref:HDOD domain-containing protein n=1 Tax=Sedimenticola thiotaurini TaxID=1543721 RepID=A0A831W3H4_9GAMM|nr:HDOD domain-containing protein [Sedimenticola thiotaurini]